MSTLYVRNVPEELYERLRERAAERGVSIAAEAIRLLELGLRVDPEGARDLLDEIERTRPAPRQGGLDVGELIRQSRAPDAPGADPPPGDPEQDPAP
jgi:plasmid stability protein